MTPLILAVLLASTDPSAAQTTGGSPPSSQGSAQAANRQIKDPDKMVCRSEEQVGSNIRVRRCMTQGQWELEAERVRQYFQDVRLHSGINGGAQSSPMSAAQ